jgi:hypothetical protein
LKKIGALCDNHSEAKEKGTSPAVLPILLPRRFAMRCRFYRIKCSCWFITALTALMLCQACDRQQPPPAASPSSEGVRNFTGTWTAIGKRQEMQLGPERQATIFSYTGSLLLSGPQRLKTGFKAEIIGFADSDGGMQGRAVWTDERGEKVYSELHSEAAEPGSLITGLFIGGTGRYHGVTGEYTFKWQRMTDTGEGEVSGRVVDLKGSAHLGSPEVSEMQAAPGGQQ